jgi:hypothetical protein
MARSLRNRRLIVQTDLHAALLARIRLVEHMFDFRQDEPTVQIGLEVLLRDGTTGYMSCRPEQLRLITATPLLWEIAQCQ